MRIVNMVVSSDSWAIYFGKEMKTRPASIAFTDKQAGSCFKNWSKRRPETKNPAAACF
jgi:hypothetical protein